MKPLQFITADEIEAIHDATLRILSEIGIVMTHDEGREILSGGGATVEGDRVRLPAEMVEKALALCPSEVKVRGRSGESITLGDGSLHWHNLGGARDVYCPVEGKPRWATLKDIRESTILLDALENVTSVTPLYTPQNVPGHLMSLAMYRYALPHTTKPLQGPGVASAVEVDIAVRMAEVIGPAHEVLSLSVSPVSPLRFPDHATESMIAIARQGISFAPLPCPTAGTTAPMSIAGAITQQNAENLAAITLVQLLQPGLPVVYCGRLAMMEPRTAISVWGGVELGIASAGTVQIGHRYGLPVNVYGLSTNAYSPDIQNGYERAMNALIPALAGADELSGIGEFGAGTISSSAQIVADNEIAGSVNRTVRGIAADENAIALEVMRRAMGSSGNFLSERHTIDYLRGGEIYLTELAERGSFAEWNSNGRKGMGEQAQEKADRILAEHVVPPLSQEQQQMLDQLMDEADRLLGPSGQ